MMTTALLALLAAMPTYKGSGTFTVAPGTVNCTAPMPTAAAAPAANDILLLVVESENEAIALSTANGFVEVSKDAQAPLRLAVLLLATIGMPGWAQVSFVGGGTECAVTATSCTPTINAASVQNDILDTNGQLQSIGEGLATNNLTLDSTNAVRCLTCHSLHHADSNSLTEDLR